MKVFIDEFNGDPLFPMEVNSSDTVLKMKQKIYKCTGFPVSEQAIFFKGEALLDTKDNRTLQECGVVQGSHFNFFHPSIPVDKNVKEVCRYHYQTRQSSVDFANIVRCSPEETNNLQEYCLNKNQVFQREQRINDQAYPTRFGLGKDREFPVRFGLGEDRAFPVRFGIRNQDPVQEELPQPKQVVNIPDSLERNSNTRPRNLRVMISEYSGEIPDRRKFAVDVNEDDNVEVLKREIVKIQGLNLPPDGYYCFTHKEKVLDENKSFRTNGVAFLDSIEIFPLQLI